MMWRRQAGVDSDRSTVQCAGDGQQGGGGVLQWGLRTANTPSLHQHLLCAGVGGCHVQVRQEASEEDLWGDSPAAGGAEGVLCEGFIRPAAALHPMFADEGEGGGVEWSKYGLVDEGLLNAIRSAASQSNTEGGRMLCDLWVLCVITISCVCLRGDPCCGCCSPAAAAMQQLLHMPPPSAWLTPSAKTNPRVPTSHLTADVILGCNMCVSLLCCCYYPCPPPTFLRPLPPFHAHPLHPLPPLQSCSS
jgi:hypothetical protein